MASNISALELQPHSVRDDPKEATNRIGIVDIGSNTVRMVVYDAPARLPVPIFNERVACRLGEGLGKTGKLNPEGVDLALSALDRFCALAREMKVDHFRMVATAAVRESEDGPEFAASVERRCGFPVEILSGSDEARLGAVGILGGIPNAEGLIGDMGGGSLDLASIGSGQYGESASFPIGHLRITEDSEGSVRKAQKIIDGHLEHIPWFPEIAGKDFYAVGGIWRAIARIHIQQNDYPLHVIDNYTVTIQSARDLTSVISRQSIASLQGIPKAARRRADTLPMASLVLNRVLKLAAPKRLIFSGYGLREGLFFDLLPLKMKKDDPLISVCEGFARRSRRFSVHGAEIAEWVRPILPNLSPKDSRILKAAALMSDIGWTEHPDYRALHSFIRVLRLPIAGVSHRARILLALAIFVRYNGRRKQYEVQQVRSLLSEADQQTAATIGLSLRLAHVLSGGVPGLLPKTKLNYLDGNIVLDLANDRSLFKSNAVEKIVSNLAEVKGVQYDIL